MKLKAGHIVAERYEIDDTIGSGGMSVVYRAHDKKLDRFVTFKVLKEEYLADENLISRFPEEARAAAGLNHQNIASIYDEGRDGDILFIVLEYVEGASLKEHIVRKAPFDDETNLGVAIQVAEGLSEAHKNNIIHLDIKPQNILVTNTGVVKVTDFGIARAAKTATLTAGAGSMGSVHYFSPEQARGGYIDHKSDIYSLGIVMYEMATGQLPYDGENEVSVALQHINDPLPDITRINRDVSESVIRIVQKATEKSASKRYQTVDDMADDLKRALTDASGSFVVAEASEDSPTRFISQENRDSIRRRKMRQAFLDGNDPPAEEELPASNYPEYTYYEDEHVEEYVEVRKPVPRPDKKSDKVSVYLGILLGVIVAAIIGFVAYSIYQRLSGTDEYVLAPSVEGMTHEEARNLANELGINLVVFDRIHSDEFEYGVIIEQIQAPDFALDPRDPFHVIVSLGPEARYDAPNLESLTLTDARAIVENLPIEIHLVIDYFDDETLPRDYVQSQDPPLGTPLRDGDAITLRVARGPDLGYVTVPNIGRITEAEALEKLREAQLIPGVILLESSTIYAEGFVIRQEPEFGEEVPRDSMVSFVLSTGPEAPPPTPDPPPSPTPTPTPTATPTPSPPPDPVDDPNGDDPGDDPPPAPEPVERYFTIAPWAFPEGTETIHLVITRQDGNQAAVPILNDPSASITRFPITITETGTGSSIFRVITIEPDGREVLRTTIPITFTD
ncbi:MAG: Stk1 family PASTA domain-containing Ser/Thr kinase [Defluviitaleaceae bacterium]|nr:Stk1 family PASTA domain-containing Ser/Thr kinase [Defluviitaleaceae bacterium]